MALNYIFEAGDTAYYPFLNNGKGKPMTVLGARVKRYRSGKMFVKYFFEGHTEDGRGLTDRLIDDAKDNVDNAYDNLIVVCGAEGSGKSNWAVNFCKMYDPTFTLQERYIYDYLPFLEKLEDDFANARGGRAYLMDEATNLASNRDWQKEDNKNFIQLLEMFRSRGLTLVLCIPSFDRLDKYIREHRARFKIECLDLPEGKKFGGRGYYELTIYRTNTFVGIGTFPKMSEEDKQIYEKLKEESQLKKLQEMKSAASGESNGGERLKLATERTKGMAMWFLDREGWGYDEVSERFDIPKSTLRRWRTEMRER